MHDTPYRNAVMSEDGRIDCEINHPTYGWIPFTADPNDQEQHGRELHIKILEEGFYRPLTPQEKLDRAAATSLMKAQYEAAEYLHKSDAYIMNLVEKGEPIPEDVKQARLEARKLLGSTSVQAPSIPASLKR